MAMLLFNYKLAKLIRVYHLPQFFSLTLGCHPLHQHPLSTSTRQPLGQPLEALYAFVSLAKTANPITTAINTAAINTIFFFINLNF